MRRPRKSIEADVWREFDRIACEKYDGRHWVIGHKSGVRAGFGAPVAQVALYPSAVLAMRAAVEEERDA